MTAQFLVSLLGHLGSFGRPWTYIFLFHRICSLRNSCKAWAWSWTIRQQWLLKIRLRYILGLIKLTAEENWTLYDLPTCSNSLFLFLDQYRCTVSSLCSVFLKEHLGSFGSLGAWELGSLGTLGAVGAPAFWNLVTQSIIRESWNEERLKNSGLDFN